MLKAELTQPGTSDSSGVTKRLVLLTKYKSAQQLNFPMLK